VLTLEVGLRGLDDRLEDAASVLGASRWYVLRRVTLPLLGPQVAAALVLSWARALGEFGATITFAGNLRTQIARRTSSSRAIPTPRTRSRCC
jgi:molybdate transport system permease protein